MVNLQTVVSMTLNNIHILLSVIILQFLKLFSKKRKKNQQTRMLADPGEMKLNERADKPDSVENGHQSRPIVANGLKPPPRDGRAGLLSLHGVAPNRVYSIVPSPDDGRALISAFPPLPRIGVAVYLCCTCPRVAPGGCYPLSLPYGARTFLTHRLSPCTCGRLARSLDHSNLVKF